MQKAFFYKIMENLELIKQCEAKAQEWLSPAFDEETRQAVVTVEGDIAPEFDDSFIIHRSILFSRNVNWG